MHRIGDSYKYHSKLSVIIFKVSQRSQRKVELKISVLSSMVGTCFQLFLKAAKNDPKLLFGGPNTQNLKIEEIEKSQKMHNKCPFLSFETSKPGHFKISI